MPLLSPYDLDRLKENGHQPDVDHIPVVLLMAIHQGDVLMQFMLTHVDPNYPDQAYGLIDFGHGKPRMGMVFIPQLENTDPRYDIHVEQEPYFKPERPISVYAIASQIRGYITTSEPILKMADARIEFNRERDVFTHPIREQQKSDSPAFLPFPNLN